MLMLTIIMGEQQLHLYAKIFCSKKCICANGKKYLCKLFKTSLSQVQSLLCEASKAWNLVKRKKSYASFKVLKIEATFREAIFLKYCIGFYEDNKGSHP